VHDYRSRVAGRHSRRNVRADRAAAKRFGTEAAEGLRSVIVRLNIISEGADRELDALRRTVQVYQGAAGHERVIEILDEQAARGVHADTLDLIGHSRRGMLVLGKWLLDDSPQTAATFRTLLRPALDKIGIQKIRVLGCSTAVIEKGWSAIRRIAAASGRNVFGTKRYVSKTDYSNEGFISDEALAGALGPQPQRPDPVGFLSSAANPIPISAVDLNAGPRLTNDQPLLPVNEAIAERILSFVDGTRSWVLPGLLSEARPIVLWSESNRIHRLEILFDHLVVRGYGAYPDDDHGRLYRVRDPEGLCNFIDRLLHPRTGNQDSLP
ncbi:MAG TPA: hypothetical protein VGC41_14075, partial [Kofleriaceae bacterium]